MTHDERLKMMQTWQERGIALEDATRDVRRVFLGITSDECALMSASESIREAYTALVALRIGDALGWLDWWWYETKHGQQKPPFSAKANSWKRRRQIRTLEDLCKIIEADLPDVR